MKFEATLPWPPASISPNAKRAAHWSRYRGPAADYRWQCQVLTLAVLGRHRFKEPPKVQVHYYPPDARRRDDDNITGAFKHGRDGIADAIRHDDHTWRPVNHFHPPHRPDGKVVVILEDSHA